MLIEGLASRLYRKDNYGVTPYLHHFLDEENSRLYHKYVNKIPKKGIFFVQIHTHLITS